jgi:EAL domain-containing protein (putative c-di-GMP-specific phosphodiesterase class I)
VNHSLGLALADRLLVEVAHRLQAWVRANDAITQGGHGFTLARLGGDEFTVLLDDIHDASDAIRVAERLREALHKPFVVEGHDVFVTCQRRHHDEPYGIPGSRGRPAGRGDRAPSCQGRQRDRLRAVRHRHARPRRLAVTRRDRHAPGESNAARSRCTTSRFVATRGGMLTGLEALVRWRHPTHGFIDPADFIPIAEDTEMIVLIGRQVLAQSCRQMVAWQKRFGSAAPRIMCVNVSSKQFADDDLVGVVQAVLEESGLQPSHLKLEITESAFLGDFGRAQRTLRRLQALGVAWSLDDFGTGYSSLSYLHRLQVETVKVDRSFVSRIGLDDGSEMVRVIAGIAHNMGMDVVAEGVETLDQLEWLRAIGCEYAQGFYFSKPVDVTAATVLIASPPWRANALPPHGRRGSAPDVAAETPVIRRVS